MNARKFFRIQADYGWGYLLRKRKEPTACGERISEARRFYHRGIRSAWRVYTEDNKIVKEADEVIDRAIKQANELSLKDEDKMSEESYTRAISLFVKAIRKAHNDYAEAVAQVLKVFVKDMERV